jgi:frataxin-like iron-binding protein CyaY
VENREKIVSSLFACVDLDEGVIRAEAATMKEWIAGKSKDDVMAALKGETESPFKASVMSAKGDEYWMYSRFFGIGMVAMMDETNVEMNADDVYPVMEDWMSNGLGKSHFTACSDSDTYFKIKNKLDLMETMMKEIEIREKKRMAQRLEEKAEAAIRKAERDAEMQKEIADEAAKDVAKA